MRWSGIGRTGDTHLLLKAAQVAQGPSDMGYLIPLGLCGPPVITPPNLCLHWTLELFRPVAMLPRAPGKALSSTRGQILGKGSWDVGRAKGCCRESHRRTLCMCVWGAIQ